MSKINPDKFKSQTIFNDSTSESSKSWSSEKLTVLFDAFLRELSGDNNTLSAFFESPIPNILSTDTTLELEVYPYGGVLNGFDKTKVFLMDGNTNILTEDTTFTIDDDNTRSYVTINFPTLSPNKTYILKFEPETIFNGSKANIIRNINLYTETLAVKPVFGSLTLTPADGNHNTLSNIAVPVTTFHGGRTFTFDSGQVSVTGGAIVTGTPTYDQSGMIINIPVTSSSPSITYDVNIGASALIDIDQGNDVDLIQFITPDEVKPSFVDITTDSGNNASEDVTKLYVNITSASYLNLQSGAGTLFMGINGGASVDPVSYTEDFDNNRLIVDLTDASLDTIAPSNKLIENTQYDFSVTADFLNDGVLSSDLFVFNSITTDNENKPGLSNLTSDGGTIAYGMTQMEIDVSGGPFLYVISDSNFTLDFSGITINGIFNFIDGGSGAITTEDNAGQLTKIIIPVKDIVHGTAYTVNIPVDSVKDGSQGNLVFNSILTTDTEVKPTFDLNNSVPAGNSPTVIFAGLTGVSLEVSDLTYTSLRAVNLNLITASSDVQGSLSFSSRTLDIGNKQIDLVFTETISENETITFNVPQGTIADGSTLNDALTTYNFTTKARLPAKPTFDFASSTPANDASTVSQELVQIVLPINSSHEIPVSLLTVDNTKIIVTKDASGDVSGTASISGTNLIVPVTLVNGSVYELVLLQGAVKDGASLSDPTTASLYDFTVNTPLPGTTNRFSLVLPGNSDTVSGLSFLGSGTRSVANAGAGVVLGDLYDDNVFTSSPVWWMKSFIPQTSRRIWIFEVKPDSSSSISAYSGIPTDKPRVIDGDYFGNPNATSANNSSIFSGFNFDIDNTLSWTQAGPAGLLFEFVEFDTQVTRTIAQEWANAQDWSSYSAL
jgi:hypothetical protein